MQYIKQEIQKGNVELAKLDADNKPVPMDYSQLQKKTQTQQKRAQILTKLSVLSSDQKQQWVYLKKLRANELFKANKLPQAIDVYLEAMLGLDLKHEDRQKIRQENNDYKYPIMLNIVTCFYKQKQYAKAVELCNRIITEQDGKNFTKAYYKKAYAQMALLQYDSARKTALQGLKIVKTQSTQSSIKKEDFLKIIAQIDKKTTNQKSMYQKMFKDEDDSDQEQLTNNSRKQKEEQVLYYNDGWWQKLTGLCTRSAQATRSILGSKPKQKDS